MNTRGFRRTCLVMGWLAVLVSGAPTLVFATESAPTPVRFENSCSPEVQPEFSHALTLLHSFEYPESARIFSEVIAREPSCVMAYWGAAMNIWHPLWAPPGEQDLRRGAALLHETDGRAATAREVAYVEALKAFFSSIDPSTHLQRASAFENAMSKVYSDHLDDPEAALFYALALLASADPRDKSYSHQFKAAGLLNWVRGSLPVHPGVLHYLIHSYDYPGMAHLALDAATTYAAAAPDSAHAQHMPSHIFTRLGLWERSLSSNHHSIRSAADYTERAHLPGHYDEGLHSIDYLMYALLQTARDDEAKALLTTLASIEKTNTENFKVAYAYAASPARYALERRQWKEASELQLIRTDFPWEEFGWALSIHYFARGLGAARSGQLERARQELAAIAKLQLELPATTLLYWREEVQVHLDAVRSWILLGEGNPAAALEYASAAADREDGVDKHPVTPGEVLPARELFADLLLELGRHEQSLEQYQLVQQGSPNRLNALLGAAQAARGTGNSDLEEHYREILREQTRFGNRARVELVKADRR